MLEPETVPLERTYVGPEAMQAETNRSFSRRGCSVAQVRGGKIVSYRDYFDRLSQREQVGFTPEPVPSAP